MSANDLTAQLLQDAIDGLSSLLDQVEGIHSFSDIGGILANIIGAISNAETVRNSAMASGLVESGIMLQEMTVAKIQEMSFDVMLSATPESFAGMSVDQLDAFDQTLIRHVSKKSEQLVNKIAARADALEASGQKDKADLIRREAERLAKNLYASQASGDAVGVAEAVFGQAVLSDDEVAKEEMRKAYVAARLSEAERLGKTLEEKRVIESEALEYTYEIEKKLGDLVGEVGYSQEQAEERVESFMQRSIINRNNLSINALLVVQESLKVQKDDDAQISSMGFGGMSFAMNAVTSNDPVQSEFSPSVKSAALEAVPKETTVVLAEETLESRQDPKTPDATPEVQTAATNKKETQTVV